GGGRVCAAAPDGSLLLLKGSGAVRDGGGRRYSRDSVEYELVHRWIRQGMPAGSASDPHVTRVECFPRSVVVGRRSEQQILVTAFYSDGGSRDVTREAQFKS